MATQTIDLTLDDRAIVLLHDLETTPDGEDVVVGRRGTNCYLALSPAAAVVVTWFGPTATIGDIREHMRAEYGDDVTLAPLLEALWTAGFVRSLDGCAVAGDDCGDDRPAAPASVSRLANWMCSWPAAAIALATVIAAAVVAARHPSYLPHASDIRAARQSPIAIAWCGIVAILMLVKHEIAHVLAARRVNVVARWRLRRRWLFPVVCTDLTDLWSVPRAKRYLPFAAGMASDVFALAVVVIVTAVAIRLGRLGIVEYLKLAALVLVSMLVWQLNVFWKTDLYYIVCNAVGTRNLDADARRFLRGAFRGAPMLVRTYAGVMIAGIGLWIAVLVIYVRQTQTSFAAVGLAVTGTLVAANWILERLRTERQYRVRILDTLS